MNFFITGLPRSRTAWLANFMTHNGSLCYHEGIDGCLSLDEYAAKFDADGYQAIGDADTGLPFFDYRDKFPDAPTVIIKRNKDDVAKSLVKLFGERDYFPLLEDIESRLNKIHGMVIDFNSINNNLREIWNYCTGLEFDPKRARMLQDMRVETMNYDFDAGTFEKFGGDLCLGS